MALAESVPAGGRARTRTDIALIAFAALAALVAAARLPDRPYAGWALAAYLLVILVVRLLRTPSARQLDHWIGVFLPLLLLPSLYTSLDLLTSVGGARVWDVEIRGWEAALFGGQISRTWWQTSPSIFWSTVLHAAYVSYYLIIPLPAVVFLWTRRPTDAARAVGLITITFLLCYLVFLFFPVAGPWYEFPRPAAWFVDNPAARLVYRILDAGSSYGAAFPSSHVAATVAATAGAALGSRRLGLALLIPTLLLTVGVVYCQMHYAVDAIAGLIVAGLVIAGWVTLDRSQARRR